MIKAYNESFEKYTIEDGHFNVDKKLNNQSLINISKAGVHLYDHSYVEETLINGNKLRTLRHRKVSIKYVSWKEDFLKTIKNCDRPYVCHK